MVNVAFVHPDLGIGGAERLVVDAAVALKAKGHSVRMFTAHHDVGHCFPETRNGDLDVTAVGDWLPRSVLGKFYALFAYVRTIYVAFYLGLFSGFKADVVFCDQVSCCIPVLRLFGFKIVFYCHFPDMLLTKRESAAKKLYRMPLDALEEATTAMADVVLVNSRFTAGVFRDTFTSLGHVEPKILYPSLNTSNFDIGFDAVRYRNTKREHQDKFKLLSINRFERKKNLALALETLAALKADHDIVLTMAGGFDPRVTENVEYFEELVKLASDLGVRERVSFLKSPSDAKKFELLLYSDVLLYTPSGEHFGIVPVEAMYAELAVVAVNDGGPLETVEDGETGYLRSPNASEFADVVRRFKEDSETLKSMSLAGKRRVKANFSFAAFTETLNRVITSL